MRRLSLYIFLAMAVLLFTPEQLWASKEPKIHTLGDTVVNLAGPSKHSWVNKEWEIGLKLAPKRYSGLLDHIISFYSYPESQGTLSKMYNNYCALFYVGPSDKIWTAEDFADIKQHLLPRGDKSDEEKAAAMEYMRELLGNGVDYKLSSSKTRRYYGYLQEAAVLGEGPDSIMLGLRIKKKGEKAKYVTMSLTHVKDKLIGTVYYQVAPKGAERERAGALTKSWQETLMEVNARM